MQLMVTDQTRRNLLKAALLGVSVPLIQAAGASMTSGTHTSNVSALIGCAILGRDQFAVIIANEYGQPLSMLPLPERGHGVATNKFGHAVVFGRRPGSYFMAFDYRTQQVLKLQHAMPDRYYYGHGVFSNDGTILFATEGQSKTSKGIIGVYDVHRQYKKIHEIKGFGIGPHEIIMQPNGILAVGVGGVHTYGREPLNLDSMEPNLSYLSQDGDVLEQVFMPDKKLSIRHLAHDGGDTILCGQQYRGDPDEYPALIAMHRRGEGFTLLKAEPEQWARFNHYVASIAATDEWVLATSPPGNCYGIWSKETGQLTELNALPDASGVVTYGNEFRVSSGSGGVIMHSPPYVKRHRSHDIIWDNHWAKITL
ncbi:DUF1513 domain-containing protein [Vibrio sagamiensis]|uniref:DUF1513 domain-containing protein n=1 Tax=Vibrio sagamiensis NBRC 104589 TaxID=1219064 RepID=A0A511QBG6_9VIBR|nr:DUF1513 domain-containing protein [Vibrio sagamiensis]PNQ57686.1 DUF1513 domain-containing protein [Vibrio agarivorans]GEM74644.1 hypothetical protein VSA01S_07560 [Vibrio sagamiensis NBRC 104589]